MPRKVRKPDVPLNLRRLNKFDPDEIIQGRKGSRKLHPTKVARPGVKTILRTHLINAIVRDGATLYQAGRLLSLNKTTLRNRYYGLADQSIATDEPGFYRMHLGASCDLDFVVDYENIETFIEETKSGAHVETFRSVFSKIGRPKKEKKKQPTLRELLKL